MWSISAVRRFASSRRRLDRCMAGTMLDAEDVGAGIEQLADERTAQVMMEEVGQRGRAWRGTEGRSSTAWAVMAPWRLGGTVSQAAHRFPWRRYGAHERPAKWRWCPDDPVGVGGRSAGHRGRGRRAPSGTKGSRRVPLLPDQLRKVECRSLVPRWAAKRRGFRPGARVVAGPFATGTTAALPTPWLSPTWEAVSRTRGSADAQRRARPDRCASAEGRPGILTSGQPGVPEVV